MSPASWALSVRQDRSRVSSGVSCSWGEATGAAVGCPPSGRRRKSKNEGYCSRKALSIRTGEVASTRLPSAVI